MGTNKKGYSDLSNRASTLGFVTIQVHLTPAEADALAEHARRDLQALTK